MAGFGLEEYKPCAAMVATQCIYAAMALWAKAVFTRGMSTMVFVVYRQAIATVFLVPIAIIANRGKTKEKRMGMTGFSLVFVASLVGATINQFVYYQGLHLGSSSMATAMSNLIPAITFVMAASVGLERVDIKKVRSLAKIFGTVVCVGGAMAMAFFKGPRLLNSSSLVNLNLFLHSSASSKWVIGALFLICSSCCWSLWLILQVPICKSYVDPLTLSAWMCFMSTLQSAVLAFFLLPDLDAWRIHSLFDLGCCLFAGAFGSGVTFYLQSWSISVRGPLYSAMFNPLCTVVTTVVAAAFLHEVLHIGSLFGATAVVAGLYIVLWGKGGDGVGSKSDSVPEEHAHDVEKAAMRSDSQLDVGEGITEPLLLTAGDCNPAENFMSFLCVYGPNHMVGAGRMGTVAKRWMPCAAMVVAQCIYAAMTLWAKAVFRRGVSPAIFVVYRQAIGALVLIPIAIIAANRATLSQNLLYQGLHLGSSQERVNIREHGTIAKISGTVICVGGAMAMAFFKGPKLLNYMFSDINMPSRNWMLGALCLVATLAAFLVPDLNAWKIHSLFELSCYIFSGAFGSGVNFYLQSWCISVRGPLYSAMFTPVCTVLATVVAAAIHQEELHVGSLLGAAAVIAGLYVVLWGKADDMKRASEPTKTTATWSDSPRDDVERTAAEPLLGDASSDRTTLD
uniref:EamA domain-containing protein n=1 Tax=Leersia perrieri TaxID=77586 RepID=A0A0D9XDX4_9ORYZ